MIRVLGISVLLSAAFGMVGCGEEQQVVVYKQGKYQGKPDTPAWGNGDRAAWEKAIKVRQYTQHEDRRLYP